MVCMPDCFFGGKTRHEKISSSLRRSMKYDVEFLFNSTSVWCAKALVNCENFVRFELGIFSTNITMEHKRIYENVFNWTICTTIVLQFWNDVLVWASFRPVRISSSFNKLFARLFGSYRKFPLSSPFSLLRERVFGLKFQREFLVETVQRNHFV